MTGSFCTYFTIAIILIKGYIFVQWQGPIITSIPKFVYSMPPLRFHYSLFAILSFLAHQGHFLPFSTIAEVPRFPS